MQLCAEAGSVVTIGTGVGVGDTVTTGGLPEVHPLTIIRQAVIIRRTKTKPEVLPAIVCRFRREYDNYLVGLKEIFCCAGSSKKLKRLREFHPPNAMRPMRYYVIIAITAGGVREGQALSPLP